MKEKIYLYNNKDVNDLKKDLIIKSIYLFSFSITLIWQIILLAFNIYNDDLNVLKILVTITVITSSISFCFVIAVNGIANLKILSKIKHKGQTIENITIISNGKKTSFFKIYSMIANIISILMIIVLVCGITYSILDFVNNSIFTYYLPFLLQLSLSGFYSAYYTLNELKMIKKVQEYNSIY